MEDRPVEERDDERADVLRDGADTEALRPVRAVDREVPEVFRAGIRVAMMVTTVPATLVTTPHVGVACPFAPTQTPVPRSACACARTLAPTQTPAPRSACACARTLAPSQAQASTTTGTIIGRRRRRRLTQRPMTRRMICWSW